ncbi:MAG: hydroxyacylglutathione hydrolase [Devosia sp.]|uniref:hydroxyacylglutathione hydrolase n=1 Tax=Devosia sp. TaxID=1871048 RepID=UPI001AC56C0D|nr:hydroxyacylglutathione hydrolase [Devosia sp.]MBN9311135.1 hydroxyacylglutathione hydrolase [Devosia sp.]MBN9315158.1 hydroxyacylglutathione hydrolase [Devosia sp.]
MPLLIDIFLCRTDNFGYLVHDVASGRTAAIDAPDAKAIKEAAARRGWRLTDVLITHHHTDHVEGIPALKREYGVRVVGPKAEQQKILGLDVLVSASDTVSLGETDFIVIETPGHTLGHIVYYDPAGRHLFSADALFSLGVGRMFEGKPGPMWDGLEELRALPDDTLVYPGHEYTAANAAFALSVDPRNPALNIRAGEVKRQVESGRFTIPVTLGMEKATNPFLRADQPVLARAMGLPSDAPPAQVFAALRKAKDEFKA